MKKTYPFKWLDESENLIVVNVEINEETPLRFLKKYLTYDLLIGMAKACAAQNIKN